MNDEGVLFTTRDTKNADFRGRVFRIAENKGCCFSYHHSTNIADFTRLGTPLPKLVYDKVKRCWLETRLLDRPHPHSVNKIENTTIF